MYYSIEKTHANKFKKMIKFKWIFIIPFWFLLVIIFYFLFSKKYIVSFVFTIILSLYNLIFALKIYKYQIKLYNKKHHYGKYILNFTTNSFMIDIEKQQRLAKNPIRREATSRNLIAKI